MLRLTSFLLLLFIFSNVFCACPNGAYEWQTNCYYFQKNGTDFPEAETNCIGMGGHLASIHDGFTNALITGHADNIFTSLLKRDFWIGLSNIKTSKKLSWIDGSKLDYTDWDKNEPNNATGIKCTSMILKTGYWRTESCFQTKSYVCAVANGGGGSSAQPMTTTPKATTASAQKCSGNYTYFAPTNSCYGVFFTSDPDARGWNASETFCQSINGHLASIHSADELTFIMNFNYPQNSEYWPWIGLFSKDNEQTWQWSDGTPTDFLPWGPGEPYVNANFNCVFANSAGIDTLDCSEPGTALCKIPLS